MVSGDLARPSSPPAGSACPGKTLLESADCVNVEFGFNGEDFRSYRPVAELWVGEYLSKISFAAGLLELPFLNGLAIAEALNGLFEKPYGLQLFVFLIVLPWINILTAGPHLYHNYRPSERRVAGERAWFFSRLGRGLPPALYGDAGLTSSALSAHHKGIDAWLRERGATRSDVSAVRPAPALEARVRTVISDEGAWSGANGQLHPVIKDWGRDVDEVKESGRWLVVRSKSGAEALVDKRALGPVDPGELSRYVRAKAKGKPVTLREAVPSAFAGAGGEREGARRVR